MKKIVTNEKNAEPTWPIKIHIEFLEILSGLMPLSSINAGYGGKDDNRVHRFENKLFSTIEIIICPIAMWLSCILWTSSDGIISG